MKKIFCIFVFLVVLISSKSYGITISFTDSHNYWPGWNNGSGDDSQDSIGIPNLSGGTATINGGGLLTGLTFGQSGTSSNYWNVLSPGDLFLDTNADGIWDYVVDLTNWTTSGPTDPDPGIGGYQIYALQLPIGDRTHNPGYILSGTDNTGSWQGYLIRNSHPVAYPVTGQGYGLVNFSGWPNNSPQSQYFFDFSGLPGGGLPLGKSFTIGWTVNCGNDVIFENNNNPPPPVPEPATVLLLASGLVGLAGFGRRRFKRTPLDGTHLHTRRENP